MEENRFLNRQHKYRYFRLSPQEAPISRSLLFDKPKEHQVVGDIRLGYIFNTPMIFGILKKELVQHLLLVGRSGSGKTNLLRIMQTELNRLGIPFISFDMAKYGTRFLKHYMEELIILRWNKEFFFNPLKPPPGVTLKEWLMAFSEITTEIMGLRTASKLFLTEFIQNRLFKKFEESKKYPTMHDLNQELEKRGKEKIPRNEREYINGIKGKVKTICMILEESIHVEEGIPIEELLQYPVCIELVGVKSSEIQTWIISLIMAWIASYREARPMSFGKLKHVFFFDEAAKVLGKGDV